jgi:predicted RecB family nuclease
MRHLYARQQWDEPMKQTWKQLQQLPNVGPATAEDLVRLGVRSIENLAHEDPVKLYRRLSELDGIEQDPCVQDVFAAAIHAARTGSDIPWWHWSRERKAAAPA